MSNVIPKEQLSAYQRWELASFDEPPPPTPEEVTARLEQGNRATRLAAYATGLEEGRAAGIEQGRAEGFEQGRAAGIEQGHAEGLAQGRAQAEAERQQLQEVAATFGNEIAHASERIAHDVLDLALDLAKAMLKNALNVRPELVIPIVGDAIRYLPSVQQPALLFLHPDDARLVRELMGDELEKAAWRIVDDAHMARGGCRVETSSNQIDATMTTRWQRIAAALGKESDWLAP
ncbi:flagellar assembly protein FliH [Noviherbaspirillum cavernae]|uniref:Flagellar assembly protein FliH n=1 Tax=Noviherbaspirillum cavernae TaxID=2320862 RepID=A0A418X0E3_9BURK|nr:flagellar assembly protein FliH [Noviherbaspirillum cavernae]RJG05959.1 flagellar assembly protein FliH [Noviherbaspirillum cavernae]